MLNGWRKTTVGALCVRVCSGGTPKSSNPEFYAASGIPWLNTKEIDFNRIRSTEKHITEKGFNASAAKWVDVNSVIVAMYGATAGKCCINKIPLTTNQACCNLTANPEVCDYRFLYFYLCDKYRELAALANGGAQQNLNAQIIKNFEIDLPPLKTQRKIAAVLSALDDKIELNRRVDANLSAQLETVYRGRFAAVDRKRGGSLADICRYSTERVAVEELTLDRYYSTENMAPEKAGAFAAATLPAVANVVKCRAGDVLVSNIRPYFKKILYCQTDCGCSPDVLCFTPQTPELSAFLFATLYADEFFDFMVAGSKGTKMPRGDKKQIATYPVAIPTVDELKKFNELSTPILTAIENNRLENIALVAVRDAALPRLMSGEIDVADVAL